MGLYSFNFVQWAPKTHLSALDCASAVQGRSRSSQVHNFGTNRKRVSVFGANVSNSLLSHVTSAPSLALFRSISLSPIISGLNFLICLLLHCKPCNNFVILTTLKIQMMNTQRCEHHSTGAIIITRYRKAYILNLFDGN